MNKKLYFFVMPDSVKNFLSDKALCLFIYLKNLKNRNASHYHAWALRLALVFFFQGQLCAGFAGTTKILTARGLLSIEMLQKDR